MTRADHEWDQSYQQDAPPPWDIGRPQPVLAEIAASGALAGALLDAGCGTGENSLYAATHGARPYGVDLSPVAVSRANDKARERGIAATFVAGSILDVDLPAGGFDAAIDSGLFHSFDDADRVRYVDVLRRAVREGARLHLMCFSERQGGDWGPRRVTEAELRTAFADGWTVERIEPAQFAINPLPQADVVDAWLGVFRRG
jgi:cyclopropane fatty-acyl-phospholipid synthase-like methyltransferase